MPYKLDAGGNWIYEPDKNASGSSRGDKQVAKGNPSATDSSIKETNANKTDDIKYVETANFKILGDTNIRKGNSLNVGSGIGDRWKGKWLILSTTHTIDSKGYTVDGVVGRKPYVESGSNSSSTSALKDSASADSNKSATKDTAPSSGTSDKKWELMPDGTWKPVDK